MQCFTVTARGVTDGIRPRNKQIKLGRRGWTEEQPLYIPITDTLLQRERVIPCPNRGQDFYRGKDKQEGTCPNCGTSYRPHNKVYVIHPDDGEFVATGADCIFEATVGSPTGALKDPFLDAVQSSDALTWPSDAALVHIKVSGGRFGTCEITGLRGQVSVPCPRQGRLFQGFMEAFYGRRAGHDFCKLCQVECPRYPGGTQWSHPRRGMAFEWEPFPSPGITMIAQGAYYEEQPERLDHWDCLVVMERGSGFRLQRTGTMPVGTPISVVQWDGVTLQFDEESLPTQQSLQRSNG